MTAQKEDPALRSEIDRDRSHAHDTLIANCEALARNMHKARFSANWYAAIRHDRKAIGDLACWIHLALALSLR